MRRRSEGPQRSPSAVFNAVPGRPEPDRDGEALLMTTEQCIIIPAYNEEKNITAVIKGIRNYTALPIVVINDGSGDLTPLRAQEAGAIVLSHPFNMGYGAALQTGYKYALENGYRYLVQMDGDGQHDPKHISEFFRELSRGDCDIVIGSRYRSGNLYRPGFLKALGTALFSRIIRRVTGERITDPTSGYQGLNRDVFGFFTADGFPCDYPDANVIIILHRLGYRIKELPVAMRRNPEGRTMHSGFLTIVYYFFRVFLSIFVTLLRRTNHSGREK